VADLFDLRRFPGRRGLQRKPIANLEWALLSYGVPRQELYDLLSTERGLRLAFARLDQIKDHIVWWEDGQTPVELLADGRVVMTSGYNGRFFDAQVNSGAAIEIIWDGQLYDYDTWGIVRGTARLDQALHLVRFATETWRMAELAGYIAYGPTRRSAARLVGTHFDSGIDMRPHLPNHPFNFRTAIRKDNGWYSKTMDRLNERFRHWLAEEAPTSATR
jgi:putative spermidine/putrescine transport system substrate-binding protein